MILCSNRLLLYPPLLLLALILSIETTVGVNHQKRTDEKSITIMVTSDMHGWLSTSFFFPNRKRHGLLHIIPIIQQIRDKDPTAILLDAGDTISGSPLVHYYNALRPHPEIINPFFQQLKALKYDAVAVGNHDIELGTLFTEQYLPASNFPWISANITDSKKKPIFQPYITLKRKGVKVAILGMTTTGIAKWLEKKNLQGVRVLSIKKAIRYWTQTIRRKENPDLLIGLFHVGMNERRDDENSKLSRIPPANQLRSLLGKKKLFDLVISGHDHRLSKPFSQKNLPYQQATPYISAGHWGKTLTVVTFHLKQNRKSKWRTSRLTSRVIRARQKRNIETTYQDTLSPEYRDWLFEETPWRVEKTRKKALKQCLNLLNALAHDTPELKGVFFPSARVYQIRNIWGKKIQRRHVLQWYPYPNRVVTVALTLREIYLIKYPARSFGYRKIPYNRILFSWVKGELPKEEKYWWLNSGQYQDRYPIKLSDYHYHGGGGIIPALFLRGEEKAQYSDLLIREVLFRSLQKREPPLPEVCSFLSYSPVRL